MTRSQPSRPPRGRCPYPAFTGRAAALNSAFPCAPAMARTVPAPAPFPLPPVPPASRNGRGTAQARKAGGRAQRFPYVGRTGSAQNSGITGGSACKSLILEASTAPIAIAFALNQGDFAPSRIFVPPAAAPFLSLSNSLKKKKKEDEEGEGIDQTRCPQSGGFCPHSHRLPIFCAPNQGGVPRLFGGNQGRKILI